MAHKKAIAISKTRLSSSLLLEITLFIRLKLKINLLKNQFITLLEDEKILLLLLNHLIVKVTWLAK